jgi:hypothetical protein
MNAVGTLLMRRAGNGPKQIRITGVSGDGRYVLESADGSFSPPIALTPLELQEQYAGDPNPIEPTYEPLAWSKLDAKWLDRVHREAAAAEASPALAPEEKLAAEAK